jgi:hypothetical protein
MVMVWKLFVVRRTWVIGSNDRSKGRTAFVGRHAFLIESNKRPVLLPSHRQSEKANRRMIGPRAEWKTEP